MAKRQPKVVLIGKDGAVRSAVGAALRGEGVDLRFSRSGPVLGEVGREMRGFQPDLVILDMDVAGGRDGHAMVTSLRQLDLRLMLLADTFEDRLLAVQAGVHECLVKPFRMQELLARTRALLSRPTHSPDAPHRIGDLFLDEAGHTVSRGGNLLDLTRTEFELLSVLARHSGQVLSKGQLLAQVWGFDNCDSNVVEVHVCSLRRKLEAQGPRMVHTVRSTGYVLSP